MRDSPRKCICQNIVMLSALRAAIHPERNKTPGLVKSICQNSKKPAKIQTLEITTDGLPHPPRAPSTRTRARRHRPAADLDKTEARTHNTSSVDMGGSEAPVLPANWDVSPSHLRPGSGNHRRSPRKLESSKMNTIVHSLVPITLSLLPYHY